MTRDAEEIRLGVRSPETPPYPIPEALLRSLETLRGDSGISEPGANETDTLEPVVYLGRSVGLPLEASGRATGVPDLDGEAEGGGDFGRALGEMLAWVVDRGSGALRGDPSAESTNTEVLGVWYAESSPAGLVPVADVSIASLA